MITQQKLKAVLRYSPTTGRWTWLVQPNGRVLAGSTAGHIMQTGYRTIGIGGRLYLSSRLAHLYMIGEWPPHFIDHKDGDKANDRWANLRPATRRQNSFNIGLRSDNKTGAKGVRCKGSRFLAHIRLPGKNLYLGTFKTKAAASTAYQKAAKRYHGEYAKAS